MKNLLEILPVDLRNSLENEIEKGYIASSTFYATHFVENKKYNFLKKEMKLVLDNLKYCLIEFGSSMEPEIEVVKMKEIGKPILDGFLIYTNKKLILKIKTKKNRYRVDVSSFLIFGSKEELDFYKKIKEVL